MQADDEASNVVSAVCASASTSMHDITPHAFFPTANTTVDPKRTAAIPMGDDRNANALNHQEQIGRRLQKVRPS